MSKKITNIELLNRIANNKEIPEKIKLYSTIYIWDKIDKKYYEKESNKCMYLSFDTYELTEFIEILEDNTEEIEELDIGRITTEDRLKINELVRAVNELRKDLNK